LDIDHRPKRIEYTLDHNTRIYCSVACVLESAAIIGLCTRVWL